MYGEDFDPVELAGVDVDAEGCIVVDATGCIVVTDADLEAIEEMWSAVDADLELGELDAEAAWLEHIAELHADDQEVDECQSGQCDWRWA